jgi:dienelactone hydrolase
MMTWSGRAALVAVLLLACGGLGCGGKDSPPVKEVPPAQEVPPDATGLVLHSAGGIDVRYGADHTTFAIADLDGDGHLDLAIAYYTASRIGVFRGRGDGTFEAMPERTSGPGPWKVAVGDFNGDGRFDLVTANRKAGSISVLLGNGNGTFQPKRDFPAGTAPGWVEVGDFNGDGKMDLVVSAPPFEFGGLVINGFRGSSAVGVLLGNGDGTFGAMTNVSTGIGLNVAIVGDLNGDHRHDLVAADGGAGGLSVFLGNGDGTFASKRTYVSGPNPRSQALGDLNGDGKLDAVVADFDTNVLGVFLGKGDGTFADRVDYKAARAPASVAIGDADGDGKADVVVTTLTALDLTSDRENQQIDVYFGKGDGTFRGVLRSSVDVVQPYFAALADIDADGRPELAVTNLGYLDWLRYPAPYFPVGLYRLGGGSPLTVSPPRAGGVSLGDGPASFAASAGGVAREVTWSLSPAIGTLSGTSGATVRYTPPVAVASPQVVQLVATTGSERVVTEIGLSVQRVRPFGSTSAPNGFLEYLPPGYDDGVPRPLLVFLHGSAGNGDGVTNVSANLLTWAVPAMIAHGGWPTSYPFIVLSPQHVSPGAECAQGPEVAAFVNWAVASYRVDPKRVFLTGLSCGSSAAWDYLGLFEDSQVAAVTLLVGSPGSAWARAGCDLGKVAIWALHGSDDNPQQEQAVMNQLLACPAPPRREVLFTLVPGGSHYIFDDIYLGRLGFNVFDWLLEHPKP